MHRFNRLKRTAMVGSLLLAWSGAVTQAQPGASTEPAASPDDEEPRFKIELIVFRYEAGNPAEEDLGHGHLPDAPHRLQLPDIELETLFDDPENAPEAETPEAEMPDTETVSGDTLELISPEPYAHQDDRGNATTAAATVELPPEFRRLNQEELMLGSARARLDRIDAYTVLAHTGWIQSGVDDPAARRIDLRYLGLTNPTGTVGVRRGRFFFVTLDIVVHDDRGVYWNPAETGLSPLMRGPTYEFEQEVSAIREGQLVLFDHPLFGVLVQITPVEDEDASERPAA